MVGFGYLKPFKRVSPRAENEEVSPGCILIVAVPILFLLSCIFVWQDVKYALFSRSINAQVERTFETAGISTRKQSRKQLLQVEYSFRDETSGEERHEADLIPLRWKRPEGTVSVDYFPGRTGESRVSGNRSYVALFLFAGCIFAAATILGFLYREARAARREAELHEQQRRRDN